MSNSVVSACFAAWCLVLVGGGPRAEACAQEPELFQDEPAAHALYDQMVDTMREAQTLSWVAEYRGEARGSQFAHATYRIWLKKPNHFRMEATPAHTGEVSGILVGDGTDLWVYWPPGKPRYGFEDKGKYGEEYEKYKDSFYMTKPTPPGIHSIGHEVGNLGAGISMTILDASTFHGYSDSLQPFLDGVRSTGTEMVGEQECDLIEVSIMKGQRSWYLWLAKTDHLPRKIKQVVRVSFDLVHHETWTDVTIDAEIPDEKFVWSAPAGWKPWSLPPIEEGLLKPGAEAPDFEGTTFDGEEIRLSDLRGSYVWLNKWRCG